MRSTLVRLALFAAIALLVVPAFAGADIVNTAIAAGASPVMHLICNGTATSNGIIAASPIIGGGTQGVSSVVVLSTVIMLSIILIMAVLYMVSQLAKLPTLATFVKVELAEMVATGIIIAIFFGGFYVAAFSGAGIGGVQAQTSTNLHFNGPGRAVFVNDCATLGVASIELVPPIIASGVISYALNIATSLTFKITPGGFGFSVSPFSGLGLITSSLNELQGVLSTFIIAITAVVFMLGLVYSLFPIFLYLGIVMRAFPWTRAAGGIFIAIFIGFYVVFPLMLLATTSGFATANYQETVSYYNSSSASGIASFMNASSPSNVGTITLNASGTSSTGGLMSYIGNLLGSQIGYPNSYGVINGFIADFIGPPVISIVEIALAFIVALDFADILSDILGAPSLTTEGLLSKVL